MSSPVTTVTEDTPLKAIVETLIRLGSSGCRSCAGTPSSG